MTNPSYANAINNATLLSDFIPYSSHISPDTLSTKDGSLLRIFAIGGTTFETKDDNELDKLHRQLNAWIKGLSEDNISLWTHIVRHKHDSSLGGVYTTDFANTLNDKYNSRFNSETYSNELYLTLVYRPYSSLIKRKSFNVEDAKLRIKTALELLDKYSNSVLSQFEFYNVRALTCVAHKDYMRSQPLSFLNFLITGAKQHVRVPQGQIAPHIGNAWIKIGAETIEIKSPTETRYAQGLDIKEYCKYSSTGMLNELLYANFEFVLTQSFSLLPKKKAKSFLDSRERQLNNAGDDAYIQIAELSTAKNELIDSQFAMGEYHFSLLVFANDIDKVKRHQASAKTILDKLDIISSPITIAADAAFFAQLPANWQYRPRVAGLTSRNFAALSPFWNFMTGKPTGNPWGNAVIRLKTLAGHPFFFSFHYTKSNTNNLGAKVLGNTRVIGMSGTGKTATIALLYCQAQKFAEGSPFSTIFFDIDRGAEVFIRANRGTYLRVQNGSPTGFNPFQMEPTLNNLSFLKILIRQLVTVPSKELDDSDVDMISTAVDTVMRMPEALRRITLVNQNISVGTSHEAQKNSIKRRLSRWCYGGEFAWVFDNETDLLDFNVTANIGIDGTEFLKNEDARTPISLYLLHRMEEIIDGRRFMYIMDEAWAWVNDPAFSEFAGKAQNTIRKRNGLGIFMTQQPSALLDSPIGKQLVQGCATEIYLPNPKGIREEYVKGFGLTDKEFDLLMACGELSRLCLIKQGHNSVICSLDMPDMSDELAVLSAGTSDLVYLDAAIAEVGDNPDHWMPVYLTLRKEANT